MFRNKRPLGPVGVSHGDSRGGYRQNLPKLEGRGTEMRLHLESGETSLKVWGRGVTTCDEVSWLPVYSTFKFYKPSAFMINFPIKHLIQNPFLKLSK